MSTTKKPQRGQPLQEPKILLSNDLDLTAREAVLRYTLRWQIELFFKECKSVLGMVQYRFRDFERVERWVDLALATYLYLEWYRQRRLRRPRLPPKERAWWQTQRTAGLCRAVRCERDDKELQWLERRLATPGGCRRLRPCRAPACHATSGRAARRPDVFGYRLSPMGLETRNFKTCAGLAEREKKHGHRSQGPH